MKYILIKQLYLLLVSILTVEFGIIIVPVGVAEDDCGDDATDGIVDGGG